MNNNGMEIERRWVIKPGKLPEELSIGKSGDIIFDDRNLVRLYIMKIDNNSILRFRTKGIRQSFDADKYTYTLKTGSGLSRIEKEGNLTKEEFDQFTKSLIEFKYYYTEIPIANEYGGVIFEIKYIQDKNLDYIYVIEVEFNDIDKAKSFNISDYITIDDTNIKEVTEDHTYNMSYVYDLYIKSRVK